MPGEPGVRLDRDRIAAERFLAPLDEVGEAIPVALGRQVSLELRDEQSPVREDQDPERARCFDEACGGDRLPRRRRVAEAVAADRARILAHEAFLRLVLALVIDIDCLVLFLDFVRLELGVAVPVSVLVLRVALVGRDQLGEHPGERVDLVLAELRPGGGRRGLHREDALESEQESEANLPAGRGCFAAGVELRQSLVQRRTARCTGGQCFTRFLAGVKEGLSGPFLRAERVGIQAIRRVRRECRVQYRF